VKQAPTLPKTYANFRPKHPEIWRHITAHQTSAAAVFLDIGCGPGIEADAWAQVAPRSMQYYGLDIAFDAIAHASESNRAKPNCCFVQASSYALPIAAASVDQVCFFLSLHQIASTELALGEGLRVMKPRGRMAILLLELSDSIRAVEYDCFPGLVEIEAEKSGRLGARELVAHLNRFGVRSTVTRHKYWDQWVDARLIEACKERYFSSLGRLNEFQFDQGMQNLISLVSKSTTTEVRRIECTLVEVAA